MRTEHRPTADELRSRVGRFQTHLREQGLGGAVLVQNADRYYLSGTMQTGHVVVPADGDPLLLMGRDPERAAALTPFGAHFMGERHKVGFVGHGIGLEVDEAPFPAKGFGLPLAEGLVFALEPKFIFEGRGVVGVEDTFAVTARGVERLTPSPQELRVVKEG